MKIIPILITFAFVVAVAAGGWWLLARPVSATSPSLEVTGTIEARKVRLAAELGGAISEVLVEEGDHVTAGQILVKLDDAFYAALRDRVQAELRAAQASLDLLKAGATEEQIRAAEAQLAQAAANLRAALAQQDILTGGTRPEEIAAIRANLERARDQYGAMQVVLNHDQVEAVRAVLTTAESNLSSWSSRHDDLKRDSRNPAITLDSAAAAHTDAEAALEMANLAYETVQSEMQPYARQIELARLTWEVARSNQAQAQARLDALQGDEHTTPEALESAQKTLVDAQELATLAEAAYLALLAGSSGTRLDAAWQELQRARQELAAAGPGSAGYSVETTLAQVDAARALRDLAAANLASLKAGARPEELRAAEAQVEAAQAQLDVLQVELEKLTLVSPVDGVVLVRSAEAGEIALPGGTLLEIGRLDVLELTVYLPEDRLGQARAGQLAQARVDAYPGQVFPGVVLRIAEEAEFTPTNVQTKEDRTRLVYAVVIQLNNPDLALKPGMIADVVFGE